MAKWFAYGRLGTSCHFAEQKRKWVRSRMKIDALQNLIAISCKPN